MKYLNYSGMFGFTKMVALLTCVFILNACGGNIRFVKTENPGSPTVEVEQNGNEFKLNFIVINEKSKPIDPGRIKVQIRSQYFTKGRSDACNRNSSLTNPSVLDASGGLWGVTKYRFSESSFGLGDPCHCTKARECWGNVWIKLVDEKSGQKLPGTKTHLQIHFKGNGDLSDISVTDQSD